MVSKVKTANAARHLLPPEEPAVTGLPSSPSAAYAQGWREGWVAAVAEATDEIDRLREALRRIDSAGQNLPDDAFCGYVRRVARAAITTGR